MVVVASGVTWLVRLLTELGIFDLAFITLYCDNYSTMHIARNPIFYEQTKYIDINFHFTYDKFMEGLLQLSYLPTDQQLADLLTNSLPSPTFNMLKSKLDMVSTIPNLKGGVEPSNISTNSTISPSLATSALSHLGMTHKDTTG